MLVTSIFSFSQNVFYPSQNKFHFSVTFFFSSANAFNLDQSKILSFGKEIMHCPCRWFPFSLAFVEDNATMSSMRYFENQVSYFV